MSLNTAPAPDASMISSARRPPVSSAISAARSAFDGSTGVAPNDAASARFGRIGIGDHDAPFEPQRRSQVLGEQQPGRPAAENHDGVHAMRRVGVPEPVARRCLQQQVRRVDDAAERLGERELLVGRSRVRLDRIHGRHRDALGQRARQARDAVLGVVAHWCESPVAQYSQSGSRAALMQLRPWSTTTRSPMARSRTAGPALLDDPDELVAENLR